MKLKKIDFQNLINNKKSIIIGAFSILLLLIIIIIVIITINSNNNNNPTTNDPAYNNNKDVISDKNINGVTFSNIKCSWDGFPSLLEYTVTNNSNQTIILANYEIIIKDKQNKIMAITVPGSNQELKIGESLNLDNILTVDLSEATKIELKEIENDN